MEEYKASSSDFTNLPYVLDHLKGLGFNITLVSDEGFALFPALDSILKSNFNCITGALLGFYLGIEDQVFTLRQNPFVTAKALIKTKS